MPDLHLPMIRGKRLEPYGDKSITGSCRRLALLDRELAALVEAGVIDLGEAERRAADGGRLAKLPPDLVDRVSGGMSLDEAETVVRDREQRITAWAEKIRTGLDTFTRMAGNPVPAELKEHPSEQELTRVSAVIGVLEPQEGEPNGLVG